MITLFVAYTYSKDYITMASTYLTVWLILAVFGCLPIIDMKVSKLVLYHSVLYGYFNGRASLCACVCACACVHARAGRTCLRDLAK
jgi:hypothetical protein